MIKLVVFDWNGTLLADTRLVLRAGNATELKYLGLEPISLAKYQESYEMPLYRFYENLGVSREIYDAHAAEMAGLFHPYYEPLAARARTRNGTRQTLQHLQGKGITSVILSNHTVDGITAQLERLRLTDYFEAVLANESVHLTRHINKQDRLEAYLTQHDIAPHETIIVGDTTEEAAIGKNLGLRTICITGGNHSRRRLVAAGPDAVIHKVSELIELTEAWS